MVTPPSNGWCLEAGNEDGRRWLWADTWSYSRRGPWQKFLAGADKAITDAPNKRAAMLRAKRRWRVRLVPVTMQLRGGPR